MTINLKAPDLTELKPRITVCGVGGAGGNAVNNMIRDGLTGVDFVVTNTDAQALQMSSAERRIQMGADVTEGLGAGSQPHIGASAAEEALGDIMGEIGGSHMVFITAGMGGGTGTGAAPVIARAVRDHGILTVGVVTKPFDFEGGRRMRTAESGIEELQQHVDTLIVIPNQNLFRVANEKTTFADAFAMADQVLHSGVACITDLMVKEGLINLDFADVKAVMYDMGKAMMGTGDASGEHRAIQAAEAAISNPLLDETCMKGAQGLLISITGGNDLTLYEVDEAATRIRKEVDAEANIILGATFDEELDGTVRVSVVATGIGGVIHAANAPEHPIYAVKEQLRASPAAPQKDEEPSVQPAATHTGKHRDETGVTIRPLEPRPVAEVDAVEDLAPEAVPGPFIPPAPTAAPRMPKVEDFPIVVQKEIEAKSGAGEEVGLAAHKKKAGFFERLAGVGRSREEETGKARQEPGFESGEAAPRPEEESPAPVLSRIESDEPATRKPEPIDEDELEIPAFLRRQAN